MDTLTDAQLLHGFVADRSEESFRQLVRRYLDMVYASALRQVRDPAMAEDVAQGVFILLTRKAHRVRPELLAGWLLSATHYAARDAMKRQATRRRHEMESSVMQHRQSSKDWDAISMCVDEAIVGLSTQDRTLIGAHWLAAKKLAEIGAELGITEAAAKKRVGRAMERLRTILNRRGIHTPQQLITGDLPESILTAAPAGVLEAVLHGSCDAGSTTENVRRFAKAAGRRTVLISWTLRAVAAGFILLSIALLVPLFHPPAAKRALQIAPVAPANPPAPEAQAPATAPASQPAGLLTGVIEGLAASEAKLSNIKIESKASWEKWDAKSGAWTFAGSADLTAWYDGTPGGRARIDYHPAVSEWIDGAGPFSYDVEQDAYNGKTNQLLQLEAGTPEHHTKMLPEGQIRKNRSVEFDSRETGWAESIYGGIAGRRMSQLFSSPLARRILVAKPAAFDGVACVSVTNRDHPSAIYYFDPRRGYALIGEEGFARKTLIRRVTVTKLLEVAPGVYYPQAATIEIFHFPMGDDNRRGSYQASSIVANDPHFSDSIFTIKWPPGTSIFNTDTKQVTKSGE